MLRSKKTAKNYRSAEELVVAAVHVRNKGPVTRGLQLRQAPRLNAHSCCVKLRRARHAACALLRPVILSLHRASSSHGLVEIHLLQLRAAHRPGVDARAGRCLNTSCPASGSRPLRSAPRAEIIQSSHMREGPTARRIVFKKRVAARSFCIHIARPSTPLSSPTSTSYPAIPPRHTNHNVALLIPPQRDAVLVRSHTCGSTERGVRVSRRLWLPTMLSLRSSRRPLEQLPVQLGLRPSMVR
jgi:hypothetical protein